MNQSNNTPAGYTLEKIKTFNGREGQGINATICKDGSAIAYVMDDASGGEMDVDFTNPGQNAKSYGTFRTIAPANRAEAEAFALNWYQTSPNAAEVRRIDAELRATYPDSGRGDKTGADALHDWVNTLVDENSTKKQMDRAAKKKTLFRLKGDQPGVFRTFTAPYSPEIQKYLDTNPKYAGKVVEIYGVQLAPVSA